MGFNTISAFISAFKRVEEVTHAPDALKVAAGRRFKNPNAAAGRVKDPNKAVLKMRSFLRLSRLQRVKDPNKEVLKMGVKQETINFFCKIARTDPTRKVDGHFKMLLTMLQYEGIDIRQLNSLSEAIEALKEAWESKYSKFHCYYLGRLWTLDTLSLYSVKPDWLVSLYHAEGVHADINRTVYLDSLGVEGTMLDRIDELIGSDDARVLRAPNYKEYLIEYRELFRSWGAKNYRELPPQNKGRSKRKKGRSP